jgi:3-oxoacyl-[acyl-carrier-protein] synthase II
MSNDVAIIGVGCVLPHGEGDAALDRVLAGQCRAEPWSHDDRYIVARVPDELAGESDGDRATAMALRAAEGAMADAGFIDGTLGNIAPERFACMIALSKGALGTVGQGHAAGDSAGGEWILRCDPAAALRRVAAQFGLRGPMLTPVSACASGGHALARARTLILDGRADAVLCGAADASIRRIVLASYGRLGLLAPATRAPPEVCRPFSADREGFYVGEGAAAFVLTSNRVAEQLAARRRARLVASAAGALATDLIHVPDDGCDLGYLVSLAIERAGMAAEEVDLVALHGTATRAGDLNEIRALRQALGEHAERVLLMATKPLHGHLLGAASAVESALVVRSLETGVVPAMAWPRIRDPQFRAINCPKSGLRTEIRTAVKLSAGFGGQCSVNVFRRF